jgi:hypothetical protein
MTILEPQQEAMAGCVDVGDTRPMRPYFKQRTFKAKVFASALGS